MPDVLFPDRDDRPTDAALASALGPAHPLWDRVLGHLDDSYPDLIREWKYYGKKHGWQIKVSRKKRSALYLVPDEGSFLAGMALKGAALQALQDSDLPTEFVQQVLTEREYPEGRPARVVVREVADVEIVERLLAIKLGG